MQYWIDGYNLMFRLLHAEEEIQTQREHVIQDLNEKVELLNLDVSLIFDAQYQYGDGTRSHYHHLEICFTDEFESADDYILGRLKREKHPRQITVVTSDKRLAWRASLSQANTITVEKFLSWLNKRAQTEQRKLRSVPPPTRKMPDPLFSYYLSEFEKRFQELTKEDNNKQKK